MNNIDNNDWYFGNVAILDALGSKTTTKTETEEYIKFSDNVLTWLSEYMSKLISGEGFVPYTQDMLKVFNHIRFFSFGDTIVIVWGTSDDNDKINRNFYVSHSYHFGWLMNQLFQKSLKNNIALRGAVSNGQYYLAHSEEAAIIRVLGPAINDAASWYDKAEWMGIMATPEYSIKLTEIFNSFVDLGEPNVRRRKEDIYFFWVHYDIPLKKNAHIKSWTVAWPRIYLNQGQRLKDQYNEFVKRPNLYIRKGRKEFYEDISHFKVPFNTEIKYANTMEYFETFIDKYLYVEKLVNLQNGNEID